VNSLGIAQSIRDNQPYERKSISVERTFKPISSKEDLECKLNELCIMLAEDVSDHGLEGKTITLKLKSVNFLVKQRSITLNRYISSLDDLFSNSLPLLHAELPIKVRLMGLRLSNFKSDIDHQTTLDDLISESKSSTSDVSCNQIECPICNKLIYASSNAQINLHISKCLVVSSPKSSTKNTSSSKSNSPILSSPKEKSPTIVESLPNIKCPICHRALLSQSNVQINLHVSRCIDNMQKKSKKTLLNYFQKQSQS
jgi:DNA polymerase kappa